MLGSLRTGFFPILILVLFVVSAFAKAQKVLSDSLYIESFVDKIIVKANMDTEIDRYNFSAGTEDRLNLVTNNQYRFYLSLDYEFIGASVGFAPKFLPDNNDDDLKGASELSDIQFRFFLGNWTQELEYKRLKGFYVENTEDFLANWQRNVDPYIQLPDFQSHYYGGSTAYVLNPKFSLRNVVYNTEWQLKSAGSFVPTLEYGYTRLTVPINDVEEFENNFDLALSPAYYHTFVLNRSWFAALSAGPSAGIRFTNNGAVNSSTRERNTYFPLGFKTVAQLGYSSKKIIFGANFNFAYQHLSEENSSSLENSITYFKIYFGYRFNAPEFIAKPFTKLNAFLGL
ncbi:MAG: DUF4421 family protein [Nonlabens sp.]